MRVRSFFGPGLMGTLPDVWVADASIEDWQAVLDLIEARGRSSEYLEGNVVLPLARVEQALSPPVDAGCPSLRVWPAPDGLVIFRFLSDDTIDFEVDLRELQGQERLDIHSRGEGKSHADSAELDRWRGLLAPSFAGCRGFQSL